MTCPLTPFGKTTCAQELIDMMTDVAAEDGQRCEITVSTAPPLVQGPYELAGFTCPHGVDYWIEPTSEQIFEWAQRGVE